MARFDGYLFSKLEAIGTRSEGIQYILQQWDYSEFPVIKQARPWQGDARLHPFLAKKVTIEGMLSSQGIQYSLIRDFQRRVPGPSLPPGTGPTSPSESRRTLSYGDSGDDVRFLQQRLKELGYAITIDGYFGSPTRAWVQKFQFDNRVEADGIVGPATWSALLRT